jgi:hypothetical protein
MSMLVAAPLATRSFEPVRRREVLAVRIALRGDVFVPGDPGYEAGRRGPNTAYDKHPALVVRPADALDVSRAVLAARELDVEIAVRGGGTAWRAGRTASPSQAKESSPRSHAL